MKINQLKLRQFRNIKCADLQFDKGFSVFLGKNAQGKTSILEALTVALNGYSFRSKKPAHWIHNDCEDARVFVDYFVQNVNGDMKCSIHGTRLKHVLCEKPIRSTLLPWRFPMVIFSPDSLNSMKLGPDYRRDLLDFSTVLSTSQGCETRSRFQKALRQRNAYLDQLKKKQAFDLGVLDSLSEIYIREAEALIKHRLQGLKMLKPYLEQTLRTILPDYRTVDFVYHRSKCDLNPVEPLPQNPPLYQMLHDRLRELQESEIARGVTLSGPQRDDWDIEVDRCPVTTHVSQGDQRSVILAFKAAYLRLRGDFFHTRPILLLDDVFSELDDVRQTSLVELISAIEAQVFLTTVDSGAVRRLGHFDFQVYSVDQGAVTRV